MGESAYLDYCRNINFDMLELLGSEYVIDHVVAEHNVRMKDEIYKCYVSDIAKVMSEIWGAKVPERYYDMISPPLPEDTYKTGDEVALEVIRRLGLKVRDDERI